MGKLSAVESGTVASITEVESMSDSNKRGYLLRLLWVFFRWISKELSGKRVIKVRHCHRTQRHCPLEARSIWHSRDELLWPSFAAAQKRVHNMLPTGQADSACISSSPTDACFISPSEPAVPESRVEHVSLWATCVSLDGITRWTRTMVIF